MDDDSSQMAWGYDYDNEIWVELGVDEDGALIVVAE